MKPKKYYHTVTFQNDPNVGIYRGPIVDSFAVASKPDDQTQDMELIYEEKSLYGHWEITRHPEDHCYDISKDPQWNYQIWLDKKLVQSSLWDYTTWVFSNECPESVKGRFNFLIKINAHD